MDRAGAPRTVGLEGRRATMLGTAGRPPPPARATGPNSPAPEPPINELPEPDVVDETASGLARHSVSERVRVLEAVVSQASDALVLSAKDDDDPVIRIRFVNHAFTRMLGFGLADIAGQSPGVLVGPETDLETLRRVEAALRKDETVTAELVLHDADGTPVRVEATYRVVATGSGATWYLASYRDLSDRVEAAAALRRSEAWAEAMVQGSSDLVMVADSEGVVRYVSPAITEVLGYDPDDFVARVFAEVIHPDDLHRSTGLFEAVRARRGRTRGKSYQFRVSHRDGGWRTVSLRVADRLDDPAIRGFVVNLRDVSDRQRAEDLLAEQADLLEAIARGAPLDITLGKITAMVERHVEGVTAVIGMLDDDGVIRLRATSELPDEIVAVLRRAAPERTGRGHAAVRRRRDVRVRPGRRAQPGCRGPALRHPWLHPGPDLSAARSRVGRAGRGRSRSSTGWPATWPPPTCSRCSGPRTWRPSPSSATSSRRRSSTRRSTTR